MSSNGDKKTIYTSAALASAKTISTAPSGSYYKDSRVNLLTKDIASGFNTYRNWKVFDLALPATWGEDGEMTTNGGVVSAVRSLFNPTAAVMADVPMRKYLNTPLLDNPEARQLMRDRTRCSIKDLVTLSEAGAMGRELYNYSDFMYCKHLGKIPNNYLITLRKFPMPCGDHINKYSDDDQNAHMPDIGRLITWIGTPGNDMSQLLTYSYSLETKELKAPMMDEPYATAGRSGGEGLAGLLGVLDGTYAKELRETGGHGYSGESNKYATMLAGGKYGDDNSGAWGRNIELQDKNRIIQSYQNKIMGVRAPGSDENSAKGLGYMPDVKLQFDYELRSYDGINAKQAMLDLIGNILMVTYTQGEFFPGSYKTTKMATSNIYANLPIFKNGTNSVGDLFKNLFDSATFTAQSLFGFKDGASKSDNFAAFKKSMSSMTNNLFSVMANGLINKLGRPQQFALTSLISPTPTGQWHVTIGNPRNPIMSIGNLLLKEASITHTGPLGLDDFPTGLTVSVTLEHGKPRDSVAIEQLYLQGDNRIYIPAGDDQVRYMYESAKEYKGDVNTIDRTGSDVTKSANDTSSPKNEKIYMKYFGTTDVQSIKIAAGEAFTGSQKSTKAKNKKK